MERSLQRQQDGPSAVSSLTYSSQLLRGRHGHKPLRSRPAWCRTRHKAATAIRVTDGASAAGIGWATLLGHVRESILAVQTSWNRTMRGAVGFHGRGGVAELQDRMIRERSEVEEEEEEEEEGERRSFRRWSLAFMKSPSATVAAWAPVDLSTCQPLPSRPPPPRAASSTSISAFIRRPRGLPHSRYTLCVALELSPEPGLLHPRGMHECTSARLRGRSRRRRLVMLLLLLLRHVLRRLRSHLMCLRGRRAAMHVWASGAVWSCAGLRGRASSCCWIWRPSAQMRCTTTERRTTTSTARAGEHCLSCHVHRL